jgi:hypothetical protein
MEKVASRHLEVEHLNEGLELLRAAINHQDFGTGGPARTRAALRRSTASAT